MSSRLSRAQTLIENNKKTEFYSDFMTSFAKSPVGDQLAKVVNDRSINQSLKNIILTDVGERLFQPTFGSNVRAMLFENNVKENLTTLEFYISNSISLNEPRVNLIDVKLSEGVNQHELVINILYNTINNPEPILFTYIFRRVR
jgi:phage baseplate assembly protein W